MKNFILHPIGIVNSCFKERFGIPRQSGLVSEAKAIIQLQDNPQMESALRGIEGFSHVWILFWFHKTPKHRFKPLVRPPRLARNKMNKKIGVLATRSPHRPNPIGMSVVRLDKVDGIRLHVSGVDLLDGTPVLDVKPYVPYADSLPKAKSGWSRIDFPRMSVRFSREAKRFCDVAEKSGYAGLKKLVRQTLELDPRPSLQTIRKSSFAARIWDFDVRWSVEGDISTVLGFENNGAALQ